VLQDRLVSAVLIFFDKIANSLSGLVVFIILIFFQKKFKLIAA